VNWLYGGYPEPWKSIQRVAFVLFWAIFTLNFWGPFSNTTVTIVLLAIIVLQLSLRGYLSSKHRI
jgi:uncharacterized protein YhhL (DUF1145 family)